MNNVTDRCTNIIRVLYDVNRGRGTRYTYFRWLWTKISVSVSWCLGRLTDFTTLPRHRGDITAKRKYYLSLSRLAKRKAAQSGNDTLEGGKKENGNKETGVRGSEENGCGKSEARRGGWKKAERIGRKKERTVGQRGKTNWGEAWHSLVDYRRRLLEKITVRFRHSVNFWPWVRSCVRSLDRSWLKPLANLYHVWTSYRHEEASRYEFGVTSPTKFNSFLVQLFSPPLLSTPSFSLYPSLSFYLTSISSCPLSFSFSIVI